MALGLEGRALASGTSGGLLDSNDHAQSIFKHALLKHYMQPFLAMTGSTSAGRRLVVMDGYAGRGRYADGSPGSAEFILRAVESLRESRTVATYFAETDLDNYRALESVVGEYVAKGLPATALHGSAEEHLSNVVAVAKGVPLFLFLDPCGAILPFSQLADVIQVQRVTERPSTELLLNFSAEFTRRTVGQLAKGQVDAGGVRRMDVTCGTTGWRDYAMNAHRAAQDMTFERAAEAVVDGYARKLGHAGKMLSITVPVRRQLRHQPVYHLVFLTRSVYGIWVFADALGKARKAWLDAVGRIGDSGPQLALPGMSKADDMRRLADDEEAEAQGVVEGNLRMLLSSPRSRPFKLVDRAADVFRGAYGIATEATVSRAVQALDMRHELITVAPHGRLRERVIGSSLSP
jgi:three-Cys-motif partner protein